ncbi:MAG: NAD(P)-dependent glycerol-3-phosphate dehydrogenase [Parvibaculaceae bacterium]|nr:NAD(P)-dependent glycerol-3-phosphate dehydrogenase [Parvibaculaceae bacterium]
MQKIAVVGGGAWGTALASVAARAGRDVLIWARETDVVDAINTTHENTPFLPGIPLDRKIRATDDLNDLAGTEACLLVPPAQHLRTVASDLAPVLQGGTLVAICAKGIEQNSGKLMSEVLNESLPDALPAILSGPSFASDVAKGLPTAVTLACAEKKTAENFANAIGSPSFRPYWTADVKGAQIGGAIKNVLAIACGIVDGKGLGESARAALTARGFVEMTRFGLSLGAARETLTGLSGLGDLILTCTSSQSRNMSLGYALGQGQSLKDIMEGRTSVAEGVHTASAVADLARKRRLDLPIMEAINTIVTGTKPLDDVIAELLARPFTAEQ